MKKALALLGMAALVGCVTRIDSWNRGAGMIRAVGVNSLGNDVSLAQTTRAELAGRLIAVALEIRRSAAPRHQHLACF